MPKPACPFPGCDYPEGECAEECLTPRVGFDREPPPPLLIDLVEPDAPEPWGDRLPCHLLMREVEWHPPLPTELAVLISGFGVLGASVVRDHVDYPGRRPVPEAASACPPPASGRILPVLVVAASLAAALGGLFVYLYPFIHALTATP